MNFSLSNRRSTEGEQAHSLKTTIGVVGAKGGVGTTTIALNLAFTLSQSAQSDSRVTLIDCNLQQPDAALMLASQPQHSITELFKRVGQCDENAIDACCLPLNFGTNMRLLTPPIDGSAVATNSLTDISICLPAITEFSNVCVLDLPNRLDKHLVMLLDLCQVIVLVLEPNMTSIAAGKRWMKNLRELGYRKEDLKVVVNRVGGKLKFVEQQARSSFPDSELFNVPGAYSEVETCAIEGLPQTLKLPKSSFSKAIQKLASAISTRATQIKSGASIA